MQIFHSFSALRLYSLQLHWCDTPCKQQAGRGGVPAEVYEQGNTTPSSMLIALIYSVSNVATACSQLVSGTPPAGLPPAHFAK